MNDKIRRTHLGSRRLVFQQLRGLVEAALLGQRAALQDDQRLVVAVDGLRLLQPVAAHGRVRLLDRQAHLALQVRVQVHLPQGTKR